MNRRSPPNGLRWTGAVLQTAPPSGPLGDFESLVCIAAAADGDARRQGTRERRNHEDNQTKTRRPIRHVTRIRASRRFGSTKEPSEREVAGARFH